MQTYGEKLVILATHIAAVKRDLPGLYQEYVAYRPANSVERATVVYEVLDALDASDRDTEVTLDGNYIRWEHNPESGEPYKPYINIT